MDISEDKVTTDYEGLAKQLVEEIDPTEFFEELSELGEAGVDFLESIAQWLQHHKVDKIVKRAVLKAMEKK